MKKPITPQALQSVDATLHARYSDRLRQFGHDPRTLGWDTRENQWQRFGLAAGSLDFKGRSVLEIGCGLADFYSYLQEDPERTPASYTGFDINEDLITACCEAHRQATFEVRNVLVDTPPKESWDIVTLFGVLNFRFEEFNNQDFVRRMIETAFGLCREAVAVDMLSTICEPTYPKEDFVYYYDPLDMLNFALSLTPHVQLRHDQGSIPQREFLLILRKTPWTP